MRVSPSSQIRLVQEWFYDIIFPTFLRNIARIGFEFLLRPVVYFRQKEGDVVKRLIWTLGLAFSLLTAAAAHAQQSEPDPRFDQQESLEALESEQVYRRQVAAEFLAKWGDGSVVTPLVRHMHNDPSVIVRKICLMGLLGRGDESLVPEFIKVLKAEDANLRQKAVYALGELRTDEGYTALLGMLEDSAPETRIEAVEAIAKFSKKESLGEMAKLYGDKDIAVRRTVVEKIAEIGDKDAVEHLLPALKDSDAAVARTAVEKLGELEAVEAVEHIKPLLKHENPPLREAAARAISRMPAKGAIEELIEALRDENPDVRRTVIELWGPVATDEAVEALISLLDDNDAEVRYCALAALEKMKADSELLRKKLQYMAASDPHTRIRMKAKRMLKMLKRPDQNSGIPLRLTIKMSKNLVLVGEPLWVEFKLANTGNEPFRFRAALDIKSGILKLLVKSPDKDDGPPEGKHELFQFGEHVTLGVDWRILKPGESTSSKYLLAYNFKTNDLMFPRPGTYALQGSLLCAAEDGSQELHSPSIRVSVSNPEAREAEAFKLWKSEGAARIVQGDPPVTPGAVSALIRLVTEYPESVYSQYAKAGLDFANDAATRYPEKYPKIKQLLDKWIVEQGAESTGAQSGEETPPAPSQVTEESPARSPRDIPPQRLGPDWFTLGLIGAGALAAIVALVLLVRRKSSGTDPNRNTMN